eukprot:Tbor_TRINITY_DN3365_c0_g1::TRINITY_DN3365_c0_g1_i1::g.23472::m.23472
MISISFASPAVERQVCNSLADEKSSTGTARSLALIGWTWSNTPDNIKSSVQSPCDTSLTQASAGTDMLIVSAIPVTHLFTAGGQTACHTQSLLNITESEKISIQRQWISGETIILGGCRVVGYVILDKEGEGTMIRDRIAAEVNSAFKSKSDISDNSSISLIPPYFIDKVTTKEKSNSTTGLKGVNWLARSSVHSCKVEGSEIISDASPVAMVRSPSSPTPLLFALLHVCCRLRPVETSSVLQGMPLVVTSASSKKFTSEGKQQYLYVSPSDETPLFVELALKGMITEAGTVGGCDVRPTGKMEENSCSKYITSNNNVAGGDGESIRSTEGNRMTVIEDISHSIATGVLCDSTVAGTRVTSNGVIALGVCPLIQQYQCVEASRIVSDNHGSSKALNCGINDPIASNSHVGSSSAYDCSIFLPLDKVSGRTIYNALQQLNAIDENTFNKRENAFRLLHLMFSSVTSCSEGRVNTEEGVRDAKIPNDNTLSDQTPAWAVYTLAGVMVVTTLVGLVLIISGWAEGEYTPLR